MATTSLLLLRSLMFDNVDKIYSYLSPDVEYCHGRHLLYFIIAVLCTLVIVIGLPLLLLLEPFLNHKINFTRMKPLLDQFQGCYKDKYRCFAAYYMIWLSHTHTHTTHTHTHTTLHTLHIYIHYTYMQKTHTLHIHFRAANLTKKLKLVNW